MSNRMSYIKGLLFVSLLVVSIVGFSVGKIHKVVIQVSTSDPLTQKIALNNAVNIQKHYGVDNVKVEIVAYGPGLSIMTKKNILSQRVESLAISNIHFSACGNTIKKVTKKKGKKPVLTGGVKVVPSGVVRLIELQGKGYAYIRP
ncbi:Blr3520 protein homolog, hypothetical protein [hydrothermal vent metagenome]|uniref:Uncharacterized protein n=1 Tax=hydrothermal vent metagenome TaxID=652676 RepID=A0A3B0Z8Q9_9ZZZZ